jgi:thiamine biosynthesis lipoprotein
MARWLRSKEIVMIHIALAGLGLALAMAGPELERFEAIETHMGASFKVILYSEDGATARRAHRAAFERIAALDLILSDYNPESELMKLCDRAGGAPVRVSADLFEVLSRARAMAKRSDGAFDPTVAPVVRLWRRARRERKMPDADSLRKALAAVGYRKMTLDPAARSVRLESGVKLDLGGIAKGYASQEAVKVVRAMGISRVLVAGAGDIVVGEPPPGKDGWSVGIAPLDSTATGRPRLSLNLKNAAVSTSGDAERYVEIDGVRYSHIVDPRTGLGLTRRISVTVVARDGATADALDTAVVVLGPDRGLALVAAADGAEVLIVRMTETGEERIESKGFHRLLEAPGSNGPHH